MNFDALGYSKKILFENILVTQRRQRHDLKSQINFAVGHFFDASVVKPGLALINSDLSLKLSQLML